MPIENEVKIRLESAEQGRAILASAGLVPTSAREFEANTVFDTPEQVLRQSGRLIRIRSTAGRQILTYKGPAKSGPHKSREELETDVADGALLAEIFLRLRYEPKLRYEKYRTEYGTGGESGHAMLDETPIGVFLELEGDPEWVDRTAERLGFSQSNFITESYGSLFQKYCREHGLDCEHMTFPSLDV